MMKYNFHIFLFTKIVILILMPLHFKKQNQRDLELNIKKYVNVYYEYIQSNHLSVCDIIEIIWRILGERYEYVAKSKLTLQV